MKVSDLLSGSAAKWVHEAFDHAKAKRVVELCRKHGMTTEEIHSLVDLITDLQTDSFIAGAQMALDKLEEIFKQKEN